MDAADPRHGSPAGYTQGCRERCCRLAKKSDRMERERAEAMGHEFQVPRERIVRKLRALHAVGWTSVDIGREIGVSGQAVNQVLTRPNATMWASVAVRYDEAYRRLEMRTPADTVYSRRSANKARAAGAVPPLAYDDIDAGVLAPKAERVRSTWDRDRFDEVVIDTVMRYHDFSIRLTPLEKSEVVRRWLRNVGSERALCALTGWREGRYRLPHPHDTANPEESAA